ncbi:MAG TPA: BlaI/MecI/CopY family transcriptional regulator [Bacteroidales bacterium]|nr:BlaI/MecI/CopY family transcriptional regulator [Bacteroidales bacterium]
MSKQKNKPTEAELDILTILWEQGPCSVRYVNDKLNMTRRVGYTTTLKQLQIMHEKGLVSRNTDGRTHIYEAGRDKEETQKQLLDRLLNTAFGGSASKLVMQVLGSHRSSAGELKEIKALIKKLEEEKK